MRLSPIEEAAVLYDSIVTIVARIGFYDKACLDSLASRIRRIIEDKRTPKHEADFLEALHHYIAVELVERSYEITQGINRE